MVGSQDVDDMVEETDDMDEKTESASEFVDDDEDDDDDGEGLWLSVLYSISKVSPDDVIQGDEGGGDTETTTTLDSGNGPYGSASTGTLAAVEAAMTAVSSKQVTF